MKLVCSVSRIPGVLGRLRDFVFASDSNVYTTLAGRIEYDWLDSDDKSRSYASPFSIDIPFLGFNLEEGEMGCE